MTPELLLPKPKGSPGRLRTVTARAWISRPSRTGEFRSHVSLGDGRVFTLATSTRRRSAALEFNRSHLLSKLRPPPAASALPHSTQPPLFDCQ